MKTKHMMKPMLMILFCMAFAAGDEIELDAAGENIGQQPGAFHAFLLNDLDTAVELFFDDGKSGVPIGTIEPKSQIDLNTFDGHSVFMTSSPESTERIAVFRMDSRIKKYAHPPRPGFGPLQQRGLGDVDPACIDTNTAGGHPFDCEANARNGECSINPGWMVMNCPTACTPYISNACELKKRPRLRCDRAQLNITVEPVFGPGELEAMFKRILTNPEYKKYNPCFLGNHLIHL